MSNSREILPETLSQIIRGLVQQLGNESEGEHHPTSNADDRVSINISLYDLSGIPLNYDNIDVESVSSSNSSHFSEDSDLDDVPQTYQTNIMPYPSSPIRLPTATSTYTNNILPPHPAPSQPLNQTQQASLSSLANLFNDIEHTTQRQNEMEYRRRCTIMLNNIILSYNQNIIEYQRNMTSLINITNRLSNGNIPLTTTPQSPTFSNMHQQPRQQEVTQPRETRLDGIIQQLRNRHLQYPERTNIYRQQNGFPDIFSLISREDAERQSPFTQQEVNASTRLIPYQSNLGETRCPISLENFEPGEMVRQINRCGHIFNARVLEEWLMSSSLHICCPICRCDIRNTIR